MYFRDKYGRLHACNADKVVQIIISDSTLLTNVTVLNSVLTSSKSLATLDIIGNTRHLASTVRVGCLNYNNK